jgi:transcription-repair coupling factor (superfamily II helicase)
LKEQEFQDLLGPTDRPEKKTGEVVVEADFDALIPDSYVIDDIERLAIYRRLYSLTTVVQLEEVAEELKDRFGKFPVEVDNLLGVVSLRLTAAAIGFRKVNISRSEVVLQFPPESETRFYEGELFRHIMIRVSQMRNRGAVLKQAGKALKLSVRLHPTSETGIPSNEAIEILHSLQSG